MQIVFRVDSSSTIGMGHVVRCIALANAIVHTMNTTSLKISFVCKEILPQAKTLIEENEFQLLKTSDINSAGCFDQERDAIEFSQIVNQHNIKIDWIIVDHYGLSTPWEEKVTTNGEKLLVIDDLANRSHSCDILLDQNLDAGHHAKYHNLTHQRSVLLLGPQYTLLRSEILAAKNATKKPKDRPENLLVFLGGGDVLALVQLVCRALCKTKENICFHVVAGETDLPILESEFSFDERFVFQGATNKFAELLTCVDCAIGAPGISTWERAFLGVPSFVISFAENQQNNAECLANLSLSLVSSADSQNFEAECQANIEALISEKETSWRTHSGMLGQMIVDGGGARRVAQSISQYQSLRSDEMAFSLRPTAKSDCLNLYLWRMDPTTVVNSTESGFINWESHCDWFSRKLLQPDVNILIANIGNVPVGVVRYEKDEDNYLVSINIAPAWRGRGLGGKMLLNSAKSLDGTRVLAFVKSDNEMSGRTFTKAGYKLVQRGDSDPKGHDRYELKLAEVS